MVARRRAAGRSGSEKETGAVAAEFAVVLPIFLALVLGIFELGQGIQFSGFAPV
jgi:Flp pilus assembly protein TadG